MKPTIAIISMGAMGAGVARGLVDGGARVITTLVGRTQASAARAAKAGVEVLQDEAALVAQADYFLSILPPSCAVALAESLLPHIRRAQRKPVFVDCNAVAPQTVLQIAAPFLAESLPFVDAGIVGSPPVPGAAGPRFYASGPGAKQFEELRAFGLDVRPLSDEVGDASALKLSYAGFNKGVQALCSAMILGATRAGVSRALWLELQYSQPELLKLLTGALPKMYAKAYRWDGEMEEIAKFLQPDVGASAIYMGAARFYSDVASDVAAGGHERVEKLNEFIEQKS